MRCAFVSILESRLHKMHLLCLICNESNLSFIRFGLAIRTLFQIQNLQQKFSFYTFSPIFRSTFLFSTEFTTFRFDQHLFNCVIVCESVDSPRERVSCTFYILRCVCVCVSFLYRNLRKKIVSMIAKQCCRKQIGIISGTGLENLNWLAKYIT